MSLRLSDAAVRTYDFLKQRTGAPRRRSDARDGQALAALTLRLEEMIADYRLSGQREAGATYVFWTEVQSRIEAGAFDDLTDRL